MPRASLMTAARQSTSGSAAVTPMGEDARVVRVREALLRQPTSEEATRAIIEALQICKTWDESLAAIKQLRSLGGNARGTPWSVPQWERLRGWRYWLARLRRRDVWQRVVPPDPKKPPPKSTHTEA